MSIVVKITELRYPGPTRTVSPFLHMPGQIDRALTRLPLEFFHVRANGREVVSGVERGAEGGGRRVKHMVGRG